MTTNDNVLTIYTNGIQQSGYDYNKMMQRQQCTTPTILQIDKNQQSDIDQQIITIKNYENTNYTVSFLSQSDTNSITTNYTLNGTNYLTNQNNVVYIIQQNCSDDTTTNPDKAWGFLIFEVILTENETNTTFPFAFVYTCNKNYAAVTFDWSLIILITFSIMLMALLTKFSRIRSFTYKNDGGRFQGFEIGYIVTFLYLTLYSLGFYFTFYAEIDNLTTIVKVVTKIFGFTCSFFIINETLCLSPDGSIWKRKLIYFFRVCDFLSLLLASAFIILYITTKGWYISDLISIFIMATIAKLFKFKNLKQAVFFLITCVILDTIAGTLVLVLKDESYNSLTLSKINCPLELQLPLIQLQYNRSCAWMSLFSIVIPGLYMGFTYRFDRNKRTFSYTIFTAFSLIVGYSVWITTTIVQTYSFPSSVFIYPSILLSVILIASKRNELQSIWEANFFDEYLEKTYRLSSLYGKNDVLQKKVNLLEGLDE